MTISEIIGRCKTFEPPFHVREENDSLIDFVVADRRNTAYCWGIVNKVLAQHICDLLNREHGEGGNQRYQLLSQCCDVVRNTNLSDDIKSHLINTFMRL